MNQFNRDAAADIFDHICKMDDDSAEMFCRFVGFDLLMEDIENNRRTLDRHTEEILKSIRDDIAPSLMKRGDDKSIAAAVVVGTVSKAHDFWRKQSRDESGKWTDGHSSITISRTKAKYKGDKKDTRVHPGKPGDERPGFNMTQALGHAGGETNAFADAWHKNADYNDSTNSQTYARIEAGSKLLANMPGAKGKMAGQMGEWVGRYGPEAEKVIGPHLRRTAYRYRGTERRPDPKLAAAKQTAASNASKALDIPQDKFTPEVEALVSQTAAQMYLDANLPDRKLNAVQRASGKIPPSEGVIINADGKIITQAVGYMDDHYLPFNLKNLKGLQGGSYVRSRSSGGPTSEDIYTGLVSGARSVTVVSHSGVFTVHFDDDFRGGRRYNDKAAQMVSRYAKTLDAIKSRTIDRRPLTLAERADIRDEVEKEFDLENDSPADIEDAFQERIKEYQARPQLSKSEMDSINRRAMEAAQTGPGVSSGSSGGRSDRSLGGLGARQERIPADLPKRIQFYRTKLISDAMEEKEASKYKLDGEGYATALDALREQFPYYIDKIEYHHKTSGSEYGKTKSGGEDHGYVKPKYIRPEGANEGYFDPTINGKRSDGTGKVSADRTNYQNWGHNPENKHKARGAAPAATPTESRNGEVTSTFVNGGAPQTAHGQQRQRNNQQFAHAAAQIDSDKAVADLIKHYGPSAKENFPAIYDASRNPDLLKQILSSPSRKNDMLLDLKEIHADEKEYVQTDPEAPAYARDRWHKAENLFKTYDTTRAMIGGTPFDGGSYAWGDPPDEPFSFPQDGNGYVEGSDPGEYHKAWRAAKKIGGGGVRTFDHTTSDETLKNFAAFSGKLAQLAERKSNGEDVGPGDFARDLLPYAGQDQVRAALTKMQAQATPARLKDLARKSRLDAEAAERMRRIKAVAGDKLGPQAPAAAPAGTPAVGGTPAPTPPTGADPNWTADSPDALEKFVTSHAYLAENAGKVTDAEALRNLSTAIKAGDSKDIRAAYQALPAHHRATFQRHLKKFNMIQKDD